MSWVFLNIFYFNVLEVKIISFFHNLTSFINFHWQLSFPFLWLACTYALWIFVWFIYYVFLLWMLHWLYTFQMCSSQWLGFVVVYGIFYTKVLKFSLSIHHAVCFIKMCSFCILFKKSSTISKAENDHFSSKCFKVSFWST